MSKQREKKLTDKEKEDIINIILKYKDVIENKQTDVINLRKKKETWDKIASEFNSNSIHKRSVPQLKVFYKNAKCDLKKEIAMNKSEINKTGGGTSAFIINENNPLLSIVVEQSTPIRNDYDSSSDLFQEELPNEILSDNEVLESSTETPANEYLIENSSAAVSFSSRRRRRSTRKDRCEQVQKFCDDIAALKKRKLECEIEKNTVKIQVYKKKLELLNKIQEGE